MPRRKGSSRGSGRGALPGELYPTLDLHGLTASEAVASARSWLEARRREGEAIVRIITGRGLHSTGPAVLPGEIELLLGSFSEAVTSFEREPGGGSYRVRLTSSREPILREETPRKRHDPGLVHKAEEALAELGIHPTPALVEAEIRRLLRQRDSKPE